MKKINEILKEFEIKPQRYQKEGNIYIVEANESKYIIKKNDNPIYEYLNQRNFNYYPKTIVKDGYEIVEYEEDVSRPDEEKLIDLVSLAALLHSKTTYYKSVNEFDYQAIYEELKKKVEKGNNYYNNLMDIVESQIFMSPSFYLLARHITQVFNVINYCEYSIDEWYKNIKDKNKMRVSIVHNNLSLDHYVNDKLVSWNKAKFSTPVFDIYHLYQDTYKDYVWDELMKEYLSSYPLHDDELELFYILISIPKNIELSHNEYQNTNIVNNLLEYISKTGTFIETMKKTS